MTIWRILPGLPADGPPAVQFSSTGRGIHREGLVVEFEVEEDLAWVGNFQPGITSFTTVLPHPNGRLAVVISGGQAYVIDPTTQVEEASLGGGFIEGALPLPELGMTVLYDSVSVIAIGCDGPCWQSRRVSWDGIWDLQLRDNKLEGISYDAIAQSEVRFQLDLATGAVTGGGYRE